MSAHRKSGDNTASRFFVFMGVCGTGKSTVARATAEALSGAFVESDELHPPANVKAMSEGQPLTDAQRWPWLEAVCEAALADGGERPVMIACSALAQRYRDFIRARLPDAVFIHLYGTSDVIRARMMRRQSHFMPPTLLESQLATLESLQGEANCYSLNIDGARDAVIAQAISNCRRHMAAIPQGTPSAPNESRTEPKKVQRRKDYA